MTTATKPGELRILQSSCEQKPNTAPLTPIPGSAVAASFFKLGNLKQDDASIDPLAKSIESNEKLLNVRSLFHNFKKFVIFDFELFKS